MTSRASYRRFRASQESEIWINGGYFIFRNEIFDYIQEGEELVLEPFNRLIEDGQLMAYKYDGFWRAMDTLRDRQVLEEMVERGDTPWRLTSAMFMPLWRHESTAARCTRRSFVSALLRCAFRRHRDWRRSDASEPVGSRAFVSMFTGVFLVAQVCASVKQGLPRPTFYRMRPAPKLR